MRSFEVDLEWYPEFGPGIGIATIFSFVQFVCSAVPGQHAPQINAVTPQHATHEYFEQTGAAVHLALCTPLMPLMKNLILKGVEPGGRRKAWADEAYRFMWGNGSF